MRTTALRPSGTCVVWALHVCALLLATDLTAQDIHGRVLDGATRLPLGGAEIALEGPMTAHARSNEDGAWQLGELPSGRYVLRVRFLGYIPDERWVEVGGGMTQVEDVHLVAVPLSLDQVVVTASRRLQRLADAPVTTEVVGRADIERTGASDLASVLVEQTGVQLQGGHPAGAGVMLQGIGSERVLVLLDGQPVAGRISGVFDVSRIPTSIVERVEIVKGPQSTLYGSEAMGGVVNVITRSPSGRGLGAHAEILGGTASRRDATGGVSFGRGALGAAFDVGHRTIENTPGVASDRGALAIRADAALKARWTPDDSRTVELGVLALDERQRWQTGELYTFGDNRQWTGHLTGTWAVGAHRLATTLSASSFDHLLRASALPKPIAGSPGDRQLQRVLEAELLHTTALGAHTLDLGIEGRRESLRSDRVTGGNHTLLSVEPFAQAELALGNLALVPGVRVSWNEQWGTHVTPRMAARVRAGEALTLRASAGAGYRAPDFKELYMFFQNTSAQYSVVGNESLRPERSRNATAGAEWAGSRAFVRGQLFWNEFRDFIETRTVSAPDEPLVFRYENVDDGATRGLELEGGFVAGAFRADASYARLATENRATGRPLLGRPDHSARLALSVVAPGEIRLGATTVLTGRTAMSRDEASGAVTGWRDAYVRTDVRVARRLPLDFEIVIGADNVLDARPDAWAGFTGRQLYTSLSWSFTRNADTVTP